jgi:alpha-1,2-mannosyltransferase
MAFLWGHYRFLDLRVYMGAAHELLFGHDPYNYAFTSVHLYATYPPFALMALSPLSLVPIGVLVYLWALGNLACLAWLCSTALAEVRPRWRPSVEAGRYLLAVLMALTAAVVLEPVRADFGFGQVNILLIALVVADVLHRDRRARGALVGVAAAIKLTPLIFVLLFLLDGDRRAAARAVASFATATVVAWLVLPSVSVQYFFHFSVVDQRIGAPSYVSNQSINGILARLGLPGPLATVVWLLASLVVVALALGAAHRLLRRGGSPLFPMLVLATAGLLVSPVSWDHHWSWVALFPFALLDRTLFPSARASMLSVLTVAVAAPYWWSGTPTSYGIPTGFAGPLLDDSLALAGLAFVGAVTWAQSRQPSRMAAASAVLTSAGSMLPIAGDSPDERPALSPWGASLGASRGKAGRDGARTRALRRYRPSTHRNGAR